MSGCLLFLFQSTGCGRDSQDLAFDTPLATVLSPLPLCSFRSLMCSIGYVVSVSNANAVHQAFAVKTVQHIPLISEVMWST